MFTVTTFYQFISISPEEIEAKRKHFEDFGSNLGMYGLTRIAEEGVNGTIAGSKEAIEACKEYLNEHYGEMLFKDSTCEVQPFRRFFVKHKKEIVTIKDEDIKPKEVKRNALTPEEWNRVMEEEDVTVLDTRNDYETDVGIFDGAVDLRLEKFSEFAEKVKGSDIPKDKKVLMYCTGGIRCEKAEHAMRKLGYDEVYQLDGGILKYIEECPNEKFKGECFVFDKRIAVDQDLEASKTYGQCPFCGDPGDIEVTCDYCGTKAKVCARCKQNACSKDHAYRLKYHMVK